MKGPNPGLGRHGAADNDSGVSAAPLSVEPPAPSSVQASGGAGLARTAALLGGFALLSRLLGLARDMSMAWLLGGGPAADALVAAMRLPHVLRRMLGEGSLSMTLTASLVHLARAGDAQGRALAPEPRLQNCAEQRARVLESLAAALAARLGLVLAALTLAGLAAAPWLTDLLAPGFSGAEREQAVLLLRICLPYVLTAGMAALGMALLHSLGIFWLPAFSPVLFNVVILLLAAAAAWGLLPPAPALAVGMLCGGLAQWLAQWLAVRRLLPVAPKGPAQPSDEYLPGSGERARAGTVAWRCLGRLPAGLLGAAAPQLGMLAAMALASGLGGGQVAALYYAERLLELPLGLVGACLGMASLPALSRLAAERNFETFAAHLRTGLRLTLLLSLPAAAGLWAVGPQLVEGLLRHGAFGERAARETGLALCAYVPGLPAFAVNRSLLAACNALGQARRTAFSALWAVAVALAVGAALVHSFPARQSVMAPALAVSLGLWLQCAYLLRILRQSLPLPVNGGLRAAYLPDGKALLRHMAAALATGLTALGLLDALAGGGLWPALLAAMAGGFFIWLVCLLLLGDEDMAALRRRLRQQASDAKVRPQI